jgi:hypothetical protein
VIQNTDKWLAIMNVVMWLWLLRNAIYWSAKWVQDAQAGCSIVA